MQKKLEKLNVENYLINLDTCLLLCQNPKEAFSKIADENKKLFLKNAEKIKDEEITVLPITQFMRFMKKDDGNREDYQTYYYARRTYLFELIVAECIEGKDRFLNKIIDYFWAILEETTWVLPAHNLPINRGEVHANLPDCFGKKPWYIDLAAAETGALLSAVWYLLGDKLKEECGQIFVDRVEYELRTRLIEPYLTAGDIDLHWLGHMPGVKPNNWTPWITSNLLAVCAVFVTNAEERHAFVQKAVRSLDSFVDGYFPDGGCPEGPSYWSMASGSLFDALETLDAMTGGKVPLFADKKILAMMEYGCRVYINKNHITCYGDGSVIKHADVPLLSRMGQRFGSQLLTSFAASRKGEASIPYRHNLVRSLRNILYTVPETDKQISYRKNTVYEGIGLVILHENEEEEKGFSIWMKGGTNGETHGHRDVGNISVYYDGEPMLVDFGIGEYTRALFGSSRMLQFGTDTRDHNLPLIDGIGQGNRVSFEEEEFSSYNLQTKENSFSIEIDRAYMERDTIIKYVRKGEISSGCFTLWDSLELREEKEIQFAFHSIMPMELRDGRVFFKNGLMADFGQEFVAKVEKHAFPDKTFRESWNRDFYYKLTLLLKGRTADLCMRLAKKTD